MRTLRHTVICALAALGIAAATAVGAHADPLDARTMTNTALSVSPGCMSGDRAAVQACTDLAELSPVVPQMLYANPFTTHLVVLGAGLTEDGQIQPVLEQRLATAARVAHAHPSAPIVVTGGVPRGGRTEADAMRDWLIGAGIAPGRIITEPDSSSTAENAANSTALMRSRGAGGAVLITQPDHMRRALTEFRVAAAGAYPVVGIVAH